MSIQVLRNLEANGYFEKARNGDHRACGLFARLAAYSLNPSGDPAGWGWLTKVPGQKQVEGYSEDAIVLGNDPNNLHNVVDLIIGAGRSGASLAGSLDGFVVRLPQNVWEAPKPLTDEQMAYLKPGATGGGGTGGTGGGGGTQTPTACKFQPTNHDEILNVMAVFSADLDAANYALSVALDETRAVKAELLNLIARLEQGFVIDANIKYLGAVKGTVKLPKG
jgi:hypothetical protein